MLGLGALMAVNHMQALLTGASPLSAFSPGFPTELIPKTGAL